MNFLKGVSESSFSSWWTMEDDPLYQLLEERGVSKDQIDKLKQDMVCLYESISGRKYFHG